MQTSHMPACSQQAVSTTSAAHARLTRHKLLRAERLTHGRRCSHRQYAFVDQPAQLDTEDPKVKAQMEALNEQMQKPEVQEQMKEVQSLMQDKDFAAKIEQLREDPELKPLFEQAKSGHPTDLMKMLTDPALTQKVMAKLNGAPGPAASGEEPEINNLWEAAKFGDLEAAEDFIAIGKDVNEQDRDGRTPLHYAVAHDKRDVLKALISASANLEAAENMRNTPLHYACGYGRGQCVETLIDAGANVHATNASGKTGLDLVKLSDQNPINGDDELLELLS
ncbi:hypothetical protein WJX82_007690 [Trebouxia sp. C0006]